MTTARHSPLERRCLLALISLIRDREPDPDEWCAAVVPLRVLYDRLYIPGARSYELERRNQRQAQRRALARLLTRGFVHALALAWVTIDACHEDILHWQGGGSRQLEHDGLRMDTPRWRRVGLTSEGISGALALEASDRLDVHAQLTEREGAHVISG